MEEILLKSLAQSGPAFLLLGYVVWQLVGMLRTVVERNVAMCQQLSEANLAMSTAMRELAQGRDEQSKAHAEQILLTKMTLDKVAESLHG